MLTLTLTRTPALTLSRTPNPNPNPNPTVTLPNPTPNPHPTPTPTPNPNPNPNPHPHPNTPGAHVLTTSRFPHDAALRYAREPDFRAFSSRLEIVGPLELANVPPPRPNPTP